MIFLTVALLFKVLLDSQESVESHIVVFFHILFHKLLPRVASVHIL
jgi:hypothetical protein